jgi:type I restriction enzyme S subunit
MSVQLADGVRRFEPYSAYKDVAFPWAFKVPSHWMTQRIKHFASVRPSNVDKKTVDGERQVLLCNYVDVYKNEFVTPDLEFMKATATDSQIEAFTLRAGDVVITKDSETWTDIAVPALVKQDMDGVICGYHLALVRAKPGKYRGDYLFRCFMAEGLCDQFRVAANGITRFGLGVGSIDTALFPVPPLDEQRQIAAFLDRETAKIDALVAKMERLIELLQEKRTALINHAVTKGLDPNVPMKDSGVEWLGQIPAHWVLKRLMHLTQTRRPIMYGIVLPGPSVDDGVPIVKGGDVTLPRLRLELLSRTTRDIESGYARSRLRGCDIVYAIRGTIGMAELVPAELEGANLTQDAARVAPRTNLNHKWLLYTLKSVSVFAQLDAGATGATIRGINIRDLKRASVPLPPDGEQVEIAEYLDSEVEQLDALVAKVSDGIDKLCEYRTTLISAAVTGKIDVRKDVPSDG